MVRFIERNFVSEWVYCKESLLVAIIPIDRSYDGSRHGL